MNNGPALILRGAILGSLVICLLASLINISDSPSAMAAEGQVAAGEASPLAADSKQEQGKKSQSAQQQKKECKLSSSYPPSIQQWCGLIRQASKRYDIPADLIAALILQESGGQEGAYSQSGAVGLMQVMPRDGIAANFQCINGPCFASRPTISELQDPAFNIDYGTRYLASLKEKHGSMREALYAYGPMDVGYYYADKVLGIYQSQGGE